MSEAPLVPVRLVAGDSLTLRLSAAGAEYSAADGWMVVWHLSPMAGGTVVAIDAVEAAGQWSVRLLPSASAGLAAGEYAWAFRAARVDERVTLLSGVLTVVPDPAAVNVDRRSHSQRALAAIEAVLEGRAGDPDLKYQFEDGRSVEMIPHSELLKLHDYYRKAVAREGGNGGRGGRPMRFLPRI